MKLIYHPYSPFSRIVYILAHERQVTSSITLHKVVVCPVDPFPGWSDNNAEVAISNPIAKIPTLTTDDSDTSSALFDSRVICEYLEHIASSSYRDVEKEKGSQLYFKRQTIHSAALGILDAEILNTYENRIRKPAGVFYQPWYDGMRVKVNRGLDYLEDAVKKGYLKVKRTEETVDTADITVAVVCGNLDSKGYDWRKGREALSEYFEKTWTGRNSWLDSAPEKAW